MKKLFVIWTMLFLLYSFSAIAADLSGSAEMHSRLIDVSSGTNYSENPTVAAGFTYTKVLSFTGYFAADLKDTTSAANLQEFIVSRSGKIGKTVISGVFETVRFSAMDGVYMYPSVNVVQPLGGGMEINFRYRYNINYNDEINTSTSHIGLTKNFKDWSVLARGHRNGNQTNFSSAVTKIIHKNVNATGFYHVVDVMGEPTHFGGIKAWYSF